MLNRLLHARKQKHAENKDSTSNAEEAMATAENIQTARSQAHDEQTAEESSAGSADKLHQDLEELRALIGQTVEEDTEDSETELEGITEVESVSAPGGKAKRRRRIARTCIPMSQADTILRAAKFDLQVFCNASEEIARVCLAEAKPALINAIIVVCQRSLFIDGGVSLTHRPCILAAFRKLARSDYASGKAIASYMKKKNGSELFHYVRGVVAQYLAAVQA